MPFIRGPDGQLYDYAVYEEQIKPRWKEEMRKNDENLIVTCDQCGKQFKVNRKTRYNQNTHFCSTVCYHTFVREHKEFRKNFKNHSEELRMIELCAEFRKGLKG